MFDWTEGWTGGGQYWYGVKLSQDLVTEELKLTTGKLTTMLLLMQTQHFKCYFNW
jgi:hypothetical protein